VSESVAPLLLGSLGIVYVLFWLIGLGFLVFWPVMAWLAVRALRSVARDVAALQATTALALRLLDDRTTRPRDAGAGEVRGIAGRVRTGPLDIR